METEASLFECFTTLLYAGLLLWLQSISDLSAPAHPYQQQLVILLVHQKVFFLSKWAVLGQNKLQNAVELMLIVKNLSGLYHKYYLSSLFLCFFKLFDLIELIA